MKGKITIDDEIRLLYPGFQKVNIMASGECFGEIAIIQDCKR